MLAKGNPIELSIRSPRIEIINLTKEFRRLDGTIIRPVDDVSLTVDHNELVVLLGPSGCGKTTLLRCVAGLETPTKGEIVINGVTAYSSKRGIFLPPEARNLSMIFQSFALWPHMNVTANVAYPLESRGISKKDAMTRAQIALDLVGIGNLGRQFPANISGGQQQRVALARALVANSTVVLFDEPLSSVDAKVREQLRAEIDRIQKTIQFSGLYVTHDQTEAMELGHRIAVLQSGRIAALGSPRDVYENPTSEYVATFVGAANVWYGKVIESRSDGIDVDIGCGKFTVAANERLRPRSSGEPVSVIARPEKVRLHVARPSMQNAVEVTVESKTFSGTHLNYVVKRGEFEAIVWQHDEDGPELEPGAVGWLAVDPRRLSLVDRQREVA